MIGSMAQPIHLLLLLPFPFSTSKSETRAPRRRSSFETIRRQHLRIRQNSAPDDDVCPKRIADPKSLAGARNGPWPMFVIDPHSCWKFRLRILASSAPRSLCRKKTKTFSFFPSSFQSASGGEMGQPCRTWALCNLRSSTARC